MAAAQRSSIREYCLSSESISLSENDPSAGRPQYTLTRASTQMIAEKRVNMIIKAGDFTAFMKEWLIVGLSPMSNVSASMVILYTLLPHLKACVEDFENAIGLVRSILLTRMRR